MVIKYTNPFYKTKKWQRTREIVLRKNDYLCRESKQYGKHVQAEVIHHIFPLEEYPELAFVHWNLLPTTNAIHNTFHDRENNQIIGRGLYWQKKREREFMEFYDKNNPPSF